MDLKTKSYRVKLAFEQYSVGAIIQPTGLWRDSLLSRGFIERVEPVATKNVEQVLSQTESPLQKHVKKRVKQDAGEQL